MSVAQQVRRRVQSLPERSFLHARDLAGSRAAVESELSRLAASGELVRAAKGLYWRPPARGRRRPDALGVGLEMAGPGSGPAGVSAARVFGLTTQVPGIESVAVAGRVPSKRPGLRFVSRSPERRELNPYEVSLLEVLRDFNAVSEEPFSRLVDIVREAWDEGKIDPARVGPVAEREWDVRLRERWAQLLGDLTLRAAA